MTSPAGLERLRHEESARLFRMMLRTRLVFTPLPFALAISFVWFDRSAWRRALLLSMVVAMMIFSVAELLRFRRHGLRPGMVRLNFAFMIALQAGAMIATGGIESPGLATMLPLMLVASVVLTPVESAVVTAFELALLWSLALVALGRRVPDLVPALFGGGPRAGHNDALLIGLAVVLSVFVLIISRIGRRVRTHLDAALWRVHQAREETLQMHAEQARLLTTLSGEIAHELKNPLSSVKGLAALVARDLQGKSAERIGVLQREVERMQGILDEFLNFSRPLVPLAQERVDLVALCDQVIALHEGAAAERGLELSLRAERPAAAHCDPRKIKQVLINLIQNAIEASPPGAPIFVDVANGGAGGARVAVIDRGAGPSPEIAARLFEAGVTTKPNGSGLGLTVARALARQHGGELELRAGAGGGCEAVLALPGGAS
jgi:signal transduction histidine kinase